VRGAVNAAEVPEPAILAGERALVRLVAVWVP